MFVLLEGSTIQPLRIVEQMNACASAPCYNSGTCSNVGNSYQCRCPSGWSGARCELQISRYFPRLSWVDAFVGNYFSDTNLCAANPTLCKQGSTYESRKLSTMFFHLNCSLIRCISDSTTIQCVCRPGTEGQFCERNTTGNFRAIRNNPSFFISSYFSFVFDRAMSQWWIVSNHTLTKLAKAIVGRLRFRSVRARGDPWICFQLL